ncbi:zinc finger BED domain-containing protein RICESLEEPER 1-like [Quercus lobata]|uniref:zinc finger BED domain-containing protein RICESLEEPER 1-like n=1 Tax=Quercus lobata TaxID=97700 RepID=UPI0012490D67|nr:zinc finger BED domain-containing protein RICESLEEPER 1-like [Quercus lobata]
MEAEYVAACEAEKEAVWLKKVLSDLGVVRMEQVPITLFCDNNGAVAQSKDPRNHKKGKHIERKYHIIRDIVARGDVVLAKIDSANNLADSFTKTLPQRTFESHLEGMRMLQSRVLRFVYVPSPYTKDVLAEVLVDCFLEWNIDRKLSTITVDNCSTNDAMIRLFLNKLDTNSLMLGGFMLHMRYAAHILNLIVQDGLPLISDGIERIRDSVIYWTGSPKRRQKFEENAVNYMFNAPKNVFLRLAKRETSYTYLPYDYDWELAKDICGRLELFHSATEFFPGRKYPTTNMYFTLVCELKIALNEWSLSSNEMISTMAESMLAKFNSYWANVSVVMAIAAILDPRYKMKLLEFYYPNIYGDNSDLEIEKIKNLCYDLFDEYGDIDESPVDNEGNSHIPASTSSPVAQMKFRLSGAMSSFDLFVNNSSSSSKKHGSARMKFDHFINEGVLKRSEDFDIFGWWKSNGLKYPTLQRIVRDILAILVTTIASKSAFSTSGRLLSPHRSSTMFGDCTLQSILDDGEPNEEDGSCVTIVDD